MSRADRVKLGCYGVNGGHAGMPFVVTVDPGGPNERRLGGLVDGEPVKKGEVVRVETTGGGGWGDPLEREPDLVLRDVIQSKVSVQAAREHYGVSIEVGPEGDPVVQMQASDAARAILRDARKGKRRTIDRGAGEEVA